MVKIKICGFTRIEDLEKIDGVIDYAGLIVDKNLESPRKISIEDAKLMVKKLSKTKPVAIISSPEYVEEVRKIDVPIIQYHTTNAVIEAYEKCLNYGLNFAPVIQYSKDVNTDDMLRMIETFKKLKNIEYILVDADKKCIRNYDYGLKIPISVIEKIVKYGKIGIAGGLNLHNIKYILKYRPYLIDLASGVELKPGIKSVELIKKIVNIVKTYD